MHAAVLSRHPGLARGSRLPAWLGKRSDFAWVELLVLVGAGVIATLSSVYLDWHLKVPGSAILRAVFPMACGLAIVPRRLAGTAMGASALVSAAVLHVGGAGGLGVGAMTSLALTGPLLDLALWNAERGGRVYLGFTLAGLGSNVAAFAVRGGAKLGGGEGGGARHLGEWWLQASASYALCGMLAGLVSAVVWFQFRSSPLDDRGEPRP